MESPKPNFRDISSSITKTLIWAGLTATLLVVMFFVANPIFYYWTYSGFHDLLFNNAGWGDAWASVGAVAISILYVSVFSYALRWLIFGNRHPLYVGSALFIFGLSPLLHATLDSSFDQKTGACQKFYAIDATGRIETSSSGGFDPNTGAEKKCLTPDIAKIIQRQDLGIKPNPITQDVREILFFDPTTGVPRVWYYVAADGSFRLYDNEGFSPTGARLLEITPAVADRLIQEANKRAEEEKRRLAEEAIRLEAQQSEQSLEEDGASPPATEQISGPLLAATDANNISAEHSPDAPASVSTHTSGITFNIKTTRRAHKSFGSYGDALNFFNGMVSRKTFSGPTSPIGLQALYEYGTPQDQIESQLTSNGKKIKVCGPERLPRVPTGIYGCQFGIVDTGLYEVRVMINGTEVARDSVEVL